MQYIHVVDGGVASAMSRQVLARASRPDSVVVLRGDLAVGPLISVGSTAMARSGFWQRVTSNSNVDFTAEMRDALASPADLHDATTEVAIRYGRSALNQLMPRQVTLHLYQSPQRINEVGMDVRELEVPNGQGPLTIISMYSGARLTRWFSAITPALVLHIGRLAYEWQQTVCESVDTRLWEGSTLALVSYGTVDGVILEHVLADWTSARSVVGSIVDIIDELLASDWFILRRYRELVGNGRLLLRGGADSLNTCELRCNASVAV